MKLRTIIISVMLLCSALAIYLLFRPADTLACKLVSMSFLNDWLLESRAAFSHSPPHSFIIYSLPGALWIFSTTILSKNLSIKIFKFQMPLVLLPIIYGLGAEFIQLFHLTDGTFDYADLSSITAAWLLGAFVYPDRESSTIKSFPVLPNLCVIFSYMILILADTFTF